MKFLIFTVTVLALVASVASPARAAPITYTFSGFGIVDLGTEGSLYPNYDSYKIVVTADTSQITGGGGSFSVPAESATFTISGLLADFPSSTLTQGTFTGTFDGPPGSLIVSAFNPGPSVALSQGGNFIDLSVLPDPSLNTYDLSTAVGPLSGTSSIISFPSVIPTTAGGFFIFFEEPDTEPSFTAAFPSSPVPEPASLLLLGVGLGGMAAYLCLLRPRTAFTNG